MIYVSKGTAPASEGIVTRFDQTHFNDTKTTAQWIAFFPCDNDTMAVQSATAAVALGAQAILVNHT